MCHGQFHERIYFNKLFNQNTWSASKSIIEFDSSYFIAGIAGDSILGYKNIALLKLSFEGDLLFWKEFRRFNADHYAGHESSFHYIGNNNFVDGGTAGLMGHLRKIGLEGDTVWTRLYSSKLGNQMIMDHCRVLADKGFICTGLDDYVGAYADVVLMKTDSLGNEQWRQFYGWETSDRGLKVLPTDDNCYIISGYAYDPGYSYSGDALLIKTDSVGEMEWFRTPGHPDYRDGYGSVTIAPDGNFVFGYTHAVYQGPPYPVPESFCKIKFIKYDQDGDTIWERLYGIAFQINMLRNIITLHDGSFIAVGYANSNTIAGPIESWLFKINSNGDSLWFRNYCHYTTSTLDYLYDIFETSDHGLIACGQSSRAEPGPEGIQRMWIIKLDSAGCEEPGCDSTVAIFEEQGGREAGRQGGLVVWPNPASGMVDFRWPIFDGRGDLRLVIYDIFGRPVNITNISSTLQGGGREGGKSTGQGEMIWTFDVSALPPGLYLVVLKDGNRIIASAKLVVAR